MTSLEELKQNLIAEIEKQVSDKILENENAVLLTKLIKNADSEIEARNIAMLGTTYKRTGFYFNKKLEKISDETYLVKNEELSFKTSDNAITHKLIIGDNYPALQNLLTSYKNKIKVIYIDPPYGKDNKGKFAKTNYNNSIARDNLLSSLYTRLKLARDLLKDDGVIFCSIDDKNQAYIKCLFDEIFGEENFVSNAIWNSISSVLKQSKFIRKEHEFILIYAKNKTNLAFNKLENSMEFQNPDNDPNGAWFSSNAASPNQKSQTNFFGIELPNGEVCQRNWKFSYDEFINGKVSLYFKGGNVPRLKIYEKDYDKNTAIQSSIFSNLGSITTAKTEIKKLFNAELFDTPKPLNLVKRILEISTNNNDIVLDFYAGSGTTGHAVLELNKKDGGNRQFILCTNNEITEINPNGIAYDVTSKRLKRIMTGECYDGTKPTEWLKNNEPYGDNLEVLEIKN